MNPLYTTEEQEKIDLVKGLMERALAENRRKLDEAMDKAIEQWLFEDDKDK